MFDGIKKFKDEHPYWFWIIVVVICVLIVAALIVTIILTQRKRESFVEHYVGTDTYADQYKYAETYVNSVMGV